MWDDVLEAFNEGRLYELHIVERGQMKQDVVADAGALQSGLKESGHVEVPGILFDFGKAEIKPESEAALNEVVKPLQGNPAWKVWVVGHTDNVGTVESNVTLSGARSAAVLKASAQKGINAPRMAPHGAGPFRWPATRATKDGRITAGWNFGSDGLDRTRNVLDNTKPSPPIRMSH